MTVLFQLMKQLLMLKRGLLLLSSEAEKKRWNSVTRGTEFSTSFFNSIHLFHEKLNVKHLDGHCREIFCFCFLSKRKQYLHHFEGQLIFYLHRVTKIRIAPEHSQGRCQNGHSWARKCFTLWNNFFFSENSGL